MDHDALCRVEQSGWVQALWTAVAVVLLLLSKSLAGLEMLLLRVSYDGLRRLHAKSRIVRTRVNSCPTRFVPVNRQPMAYLGSRCPPPRNVRGKNY